MIAELGDLRADVAADPAHQRAIVEERDVLRPRQSHHDPQTLARRGVEQLAARRRIGADGVDAERGHLAEVGRDLFEGWELVALSVGREGSVGDALDEETVAGKLVRAVRIGISCRRRRTTSVA